MTFGAAIGCFLTPIILEKLSRRKCFIYSDIVGIIMCSIIITYRNKYLQLICRVIIGMIVGLNSTLVPIYVKEMSPVSVSGQSGCIT